MGFYCAKCDSVIIGQGEHDCSVGKNVSQDAAMRSVFEREIWNAAIEAAAGLASKRGLIGMKELAEAIRSLKK